MQDLVGGRLRQLSHQLRVEACPDLALQLGSILAVEIILKLQIKSYTNELQLLAGLKNHFMGLFPYTLGWSYLDIETCVSG